MRVLIIGDTHINHKKLIEWGRPEDFEQQILDNLKNTLLPGDMFIHLGDVCIGKDENAHQKLFAQFPENVRKILVLGNHDTKSDQWYYNHGWDFVCRFFAGKYFGKRLVFSHKPMQKIDRFDFNIHGHCHGNAHRDEDLPPDYDPAYHKDTAPELHGYKPLLLENFLHESTTTIKETA